MRLFCLILISFMLGHHVNRHGFSNSLSLITPKICFRNARKCQRCRLDSCFGNLADNVTVLVSLSLLPLSSPTALIHPPFVLVEVISHIAHLHPSPLPFLLPHHPLPYTLQLLLSYSPYFSHTLLSFDPLHHPVSLTVSSSLLGAAVQCVCPQRHLHHCVCSGYCHVLYADGLD